MNNFSTQVIVNSTNPTNGNGIGAKTIRAEAEKILSPDFSIEHSDVLNEILGLLTEFDFRKAANLESSEQVSQKHYRVLVVQEVLRVAMEHNCGLARNLDFFYTFNGTHWLQNSREKLESFLGEAAERLGVDKITAKDYKFREALYKQFMSMAYLPRPETRRGVVLINLQNGTFEITKNTQILRGFRREDFLTYRLNFAYDESAKCPRWQQFLDEVLPEYNADGKDYDAGKTRQMVLAEYIAYIFVKHLKLEKTLILYGTGANGKSVVFDVLNALLGKENVSNYSLEALGENYFRAMIADKLLNYSSEISNRLQAEKFKQLTSGEPVEARLPYGQPMVLTDYARLAFNCNELPKDVEHSEAFFRRFLIIPFDITIEKEKRNPSLAGEIIETELSGIFNWILDGLKRLLEQGNFTPCDLAEKTLETYRKESDSVAMFLIDEHYEKSDGYEMTVKEIFSLYKSYCLDNNYRPLGRNNFVKRLESNGIPRQDSYQPFFYIAKKSSS